MNSFLPLNNFIENHCSNEVFSSIADFKTSILLDELFSRARKFDYEEKNKKFFAHSINSNEEMIFSIFRGINFIEFKYVHRKSRWHEEELSIPMNKGEIMKYGIPALIQCGNDYLNLLHDGNLVSDVWKELLISNQNLKTLNWLASFKTLPQTSKIIKNVFRLAKYWEEILNRFLDERRKNTLELEESHTIYEASARWLHDRDYLIFNIPMKYPWNVLMKFLDRNDITLDDMKFVIENCPSIDGEASKYLPMVIAAKTKNINMLIDLSIEGVAPESVKKILDKRVFI